MFTSSQNMTITALWHYHTCPTHTHTHTVGCCLTWLFFQSPWVRLGPPRCPQAKPLEIAAMRLFYRLYAHHDAQPTSGQPILVHKYTNVKTMNAKPVVNSWMQYMNQISFRNAASSFTSNRYVFVFFLNLPTAATKKQDLQWNHPSCVARWPSS